MFLTDLQLGQLNQKVVFRDLKFRGLPITETEGKHDFDGFLPNGQSAEVKLDLYSQARHYAAIESATIDRQPDFVFHTLTYYLAFPFEVYKDLYYHSGKIHNFGDQKFEGRLVTTAAMRNAGMYADTFVRTLKQQV